jgi:hypothetical protein
MEENEDTLDYKQLYKTSNSPRDYSNSIYLFYIELGEITELTDRLVLKYLEPSKNSGIINKTQTSYFIHACIQTIPDIIKDFGINNIGVYQIIRLSKIFTQV